MVMVLIDYIAFGKLSNIRKKIVYFSHYSANLWVVLLILEFDVCILQEEYKTLLAHIFIDVTLRSKYQLLIKLLCNEKNNYYAEVKLFNKRQ